MPRRGRTRSSTDEIIAPVIAFPSLTKTSSGGSSDFDIYDTSGFSRFTGMVSTVGSLSIRFQSGVASGVFMASSTHFANSSISTIDLLNFGRYGNIDITQARSTVFSLVVNGEPSR